MLSMELRTSMQDLNTLTVTLSLVFVAKLIIKKYSETTEFDPYIYIYTKCDYQANVVQLITLG